MAPLGELEAGSIDAVERAVKSGIPTTPKPSTGFEPPPDLPADVAPQEDDEDAPEALPSQLAPPERPPEPLPLPQGPVSMDEAEAAEALAFHAEPWPLHGQGPPGVRSLTHPMTERLQGAGGRSTVGQLLSEPLALTMPQTLSAAGFDLPASPPMEVGFVTEALPGEVESAVPGSSLGATDVDGVETVETAGGMPKQKCSCSPGCGCLQAGGPAGAPAASPPFSPA